MIVDDVRVRGIGRSAAAENIRVEKAQGPPTPEKVTVLSCQLFVWGFCGIG